jgi:hypothetical protein
MEAEAIFTVPNLWGEKCGSINGGVWPWLWKTTDGVNSASLWGAD